MKTLNDLKAKHAEEIAELELETSLRALLPEQYREGATVCVHGKWGLKFSSVKLWGDYHTDKKIADVLPIIEQFRPLIIQGEHWKDGCCSTWPAEINGNAKRENAVMDGSHEIEIDVHGGKGYGPCVEIQFWIKTALGLVEISCPVCDLFRLVPNVRAAYNLNGECCKCDITWPAERQAADKFRTWSSEKPSYSGSYYFAEVSNFLAWVSSTPILNHATPAN